MRLRNITRPWFGTAILAVFAIALMLVPLFTAGYLLNFLTVTAILAVSTIGLYVMRMTGEINFGHAGFMAVGAYCSALLTMKTGTSFWLALAAAAALSGLGGLGLGFLTLRLKGAYFFLVSFAIAELLLLFITRTQHFTGGAAGLTNIPSPGKAFRGSPIPFYYLAVLVLIGTFVLAETLRRSRTGLTLSSIAHRDSLAESAGINCLSYKANTLGISCLVAGVSGSLLAHYVGYVSPDSFGLWQMMNILSYLVVGGVSSPLGAVLGTSLLRGVGEVAGGLREYQVVTASVLLVVVLLVLPGGVASLPRLIKARLSRRARHRE